MSVVAPILVAASAPAWRPRPVGQTVIAAVPIAVVGIVCLCLLSATGVPIAEWGFPLIGVVVAGFCVQSQRAFQALRWSLLCLVCLLCLNAIELRVNGYASAVASRMYESSERARLAALQGKLQEDFPADNVLPQASVAKILDRPELAQWDRRTLQPGWHTAFTGLYEVTTIPGEFWYPGGPVATGSTQLQWKPKG
jgi:hypothetical protein